MCSSHVIAAHTFSALILRLSRAKVSSLFPSLYSSFLVDCSTCPVWPDAGLERTMGTKRADKKGRSVVCWTDMPNLFGAKRKIPDGNFDTE